MARSQSPVDRTQRAAAMQRQAKAKERRSALIVWGSAALVLLLIVGAITFAVLTRPSLSGVAEYEDLGRDHVAEAVTYEQDPPVGGDHHQAWWNCGVYAEPIPPHHALHSLEHGAVWLTYQSDIDQGSLDTLEGLADREFMLLSPNDTQTSPVVATAWGQQLEVDTADDAQLPLFISEYVQGPQTPEPGAVCTGGTTTDLLASP